MKKLLLNTLILLYVGAAPLAAADFEVLSAIGVREPEGLHAGQELSQGTRLVLEHWGRVLVRETTKCALTHVVVGLGEYVLTLSEDCAETSSPGDVVERLQRGEEFAERLKQTGSGPVDDVIGAISNEPCVFLPRVSEEGTARRECPSGYGLRGVRCSGVNCDDKDLVCCPYLGGAPDPDAERVQSRWISEESPDVTKTKDFYNGLRCRGGYCDEVYPEAFKSPRLTNAGECLWTVWSSQREGQWLDCQLGRLMSGMRCQKDFCAEVAIYCCKVQVK